MAVKTSRVRGWLEWRHVWLLLSLALLHVLYPLLWPVYHSFKLLELLFVLVFVACVFAAGRRRGYLIIAVILMVPSLLSFGSVFGVSLFGLAPPQWLVWARLIAATLLLCFAAGLVVRDALRADRVNVDTICAAVSAYLLLGVIWTFFYLLALAADPESIVLPDLPEHLSKDAAGFEYYSVLSYFSFVTLSTLGYGDVLPVTHVTRMLAWVEAMFGQIYLAVLLARIVGLHVATAATRRSGNQ